MGQRKDKKPPVRRDATGHLHPKYAADLRLRLGDERAEPRDDGRAFFGRPRSLDPLAEALGEEFVAAATTGEDAALESLNERVPEDDGGPFVVTRARKEFARGSDPSNPKDATREPFPRASADGADED